jgi:hypothetical protein
VDPKQSPPPHSGLADTDPAIADTQASDPGATTTPDRVAAAAVEAGATQPKGPRQVRAGDTLGRYELGDEIGEGGMATVFRARDKELRRDVAVKVLFPHLARRTEVVRRFHREARAAANLEHPNILRIYDVGGGEQDDPPFIVMELIRGRTLLEEIEQRGAVFAEVVACMGALLADALAAAHAKGIIHRDIKPSNVLIAEGGRLLLADFGVARLETEDSSLVTRTGALLGTPAYMSPEQAGGDTATTKSDLYSLGATLYQLSTSLLPYSGSPAKVMSMIATGALVSAVRRRAEVGPDLSRIIDRLMSTDQAARPESAAAVAIELRGLAAASGLGDATEELAAYFANPDAFLEDRTPKVVTAIVAAGKKAIAESRLPRAMALADRASALAPEDPAVKTLVETVTEGDRATRRNKLLAIGAAGVLAIGGSVFGVMKLTGGDPPPPDAAVIAQVADAAPAIADAAVLEPDAAIIDEPRDADVTPDAVAKPPRDAALAKRDAATLEQPDAGVAVAVTPPDAATIFTVPPDAAAAPTGEAKITITNDTWCDVSIDGVSRGRVALANAKLIVTLPAGHHVITCEQPGLNAKWTREVDIEDGKPFQVRGTLLSSTDVTIAITTGDRVQLDGTYYPRGSVVKVKPGRYRGLVFQGTQGGVGGFVDIPRLPCRLHEVGQGLVCDP